MQPADANVAASQPFALCEGFLDGRSEWRAGLPLQSGPVWDGNPAAVDTHEVHLLQAGRNDCYAEAVYAQAVRQRFVRNAQIRPVDSVIDHQQLLDKAFGYAFARVAGSRLHYLTE